MLLQKKSFSLFTDIRRLLRKQKTSIATTAKDI